MSTKQEQIIQASITEFSQKNYYQVTTESIAQTANVSKGLVFHYFQSKENLYLVTLRYVAEYLMEAMNLAEMPQDDITEMIIWTWWQKQQIVNDYPQESQFLMMVASNIPEEIKSEVQAIFKEYEDWGYQIIADIVTKIPLKKDVKRETVIELINATMNHLYLKSMALVQGNPQMDYSEFGAIKDEIVEMLTIIQDGCRLRE